MVTEVAQENASQSPAMCRRVASIPSAGFVGNLGAASTRRRRSRAAQPVRDGYRLSRGTKTLVTTFLAYRMRHLVGGETYVSAVPGPSPDIRGGRNRACPVAFRVRRHTGRCDSRQSV